MYLLNRAAAVFMAVALLMTSVMVVSGAVWTDQEDYTPGSVVTVSGDNSDFAEGEGYLPGETVDVAVSGPNGWSASCSAEVAEDGSWSCQVTLDSDPDVAVGDYTYTATGQESGTSESGTFTDQTLVSITNATFVWYTSTSFDVFVQGTYTCDLVGAAAGDCNDADDVTITVHEGDNDNNDATGTTVATKVIALADTATGTEAWNFTFEFRNAPSGTQYASPADGQFDVQAVFHGKLSGAARTSSPAVRDNYFGKDATKPTSTIDSIVLGSVNATGTATDPGSSSPLPHFSGFSNSPPKPVRIQLLTDPGGVVIDEQFVDLADLGATKQSGNWSYTYAGTLDPGDYCLESRATDIAGNVQSPVTTECFTVAAVGLSPDTVQMSTFVHDPDHDPGILFALGAILHDLVRILTTGGSDIPANSSVDFEFHTNGSCSSLSGPAENVGLGPDPLSPPVEEESSPRGPLHAGDYSYKVFFNSGDTEAVLDGEADCEPFSVAMAGTSTSTVVWGGSPPMSGPWFQNPVFDTATVDTDGYDGFDLDGTVTFTLYDNLTCDGTVLNTEPVAISGTPPQTVASTPQNVFAPGDYSFRAEYSGNSDYEASTADCEPFSVIPTVEVTRGTCTFDLNPDWAGDQFRLIYTPWGVGYSKLNASNPGQMFVDIFFVNPPDYDGTGEAYLMMPFPFVTKGAMPVHFYDGVTITEPEPGKFCYEPGDGLGPSDAMVLLSDYGAYPDFGDTANLDIDPVPAAPSTGLTLIRVHVDYGLKMVAFDCTKATDQPSAGFTRATCNDTPWNGLVIEDNQPYEFAVTVGPGASDTIYSQNIFKRDPGIGGLVIDADGNPVAGTKVEIWQGTKKWATVYTDEDGWYMATFKYTGKAVEFTVRVVDLLLEQSVTLKSNGYAIVNFIGDWSEYQVVEFTSTSTTDSTTSGGGGKGKVKAI